MHAWVDKTVTVLKGGLIDASLGSGVGYAMYFSISVNSQLIVEDSVVIPPPP